MNNYLIMGALVALSFLGGRFSVKPVTEIQEKIVYKEAVTKHVKVNKKKVTKPDGTIEELDTTTLDSILMASSDIMIKETPSDPVLVNGLMSYDFKYGVLVSRRLVGRIHIGVFGFNDLRAGLSLGVEL